MRAWFRWLTKRNVVPFNPASELELPKLGRRLPKAVLTPKEAEQVLAVPDLTEPLGVRDRAIIELLWSTGIRRQEVIDLGVWDRDPERGTLMIREGKGKRDRLVPIGERAIGWASRYLDEVRPGLVVPPDDGVLFLSVEGGPLGPRRLTQLVGRYVQQAKLTKRGACHLFRHSCATAMLEGGADIRFIQAQLGHVLLSTTQLYTQVSITKLKEIHTATHPGARIDQARQRPDTDDDGDEATAEDLLADLDAEAEDG